MPRRGDNIRKRKDGRWEARYTIIDSSDNTKRYGSVYGKTYQEVKEKRKQVVLQGQKEKQKASAIVFRDVLTAWQETNRIRLKESSISRYQNLIDAHILPELGNKSMSQLTVPMLNHFLTEKLEHGRLDCTGGLSSSYVRNIALIINSAISFGATENMCDPLQTKITKPPMSKKELTILSVEQQTLLEKALTKDMNEVKLLIYITLYTGIRIGEACALMWEDIDLDSRILHVRKTISRVWTMEHGKKISRLIVTSPKTKSSLRSIPICSKLHTILSSFSKSRMKGYLLTHRTNNGFISPRTYEYNYKLILKDCEITPVNYHALRHTFATRCIECGVDIKSLSELLGHSNVSITLNTYVHSSMELKRLQIEKLAI